MEKQISHFKVFEEIGSGGMGVVYRARDQRLRRKVALKVLPAGALADPTIRERLMREAQTTSALNHPHIVTVFDIHSAGDRDFIAMEFIDGEPLFHVIGDHGLPLDKALRYALQIADGLACAHEHGVIHRDLKPQNIMITPADDVKILDFGLAKRFLPESAGDSMVETGLMTLTAPGVKVGTPAFMSPEQIEGRPIDERSDIFSFGCLLYQMLTGVNPFQRRNAILIFKAVLSEHPEPLLSLRPNLPSELETILTRAMVKSPEDRYQNMRELLSDLEALRTQADGGGVVAEPIPQPSQATPPWRMPALVAALVLAGGLLGWLLSRSEDPLPLGEPRVLASPFSSQSQPAISPLGDRIAFTSSDFAISVRPLAGGAASRITPLDVAAEHSNWTPDGRLIFGQRGRGIWSVEVASDSSPRLLLEDGSLPSLSRDGQTLVAEVDDRVMIAAVDGSNARHVSSIPSAFFSRWVARSPALSADGREIAYFQPEAGDLGGLWVAPVDGGEPRRLFDGLFRGGDPAWTADGWIVFSASFAGKSQAGQRQQLWRVPADGGEPERLTHGAGHHSEPALSTDDQQLAFVVGTESYALEHLDPQTGASSKLEKGHYRIGRPAVSPSGDRVAFHAPQGSGIQLFVWTAEEGTVQITAGGERSLLPQWSADGAHLYYYHEGAQTSFRRISLSSSGGASDTVLTGWSRWRQYDTVVGPQGERVVYTPIENGEPGRLRVHEIASGQEQELGQILLTPSWSPDGTEVLGSDAADRIYLCRAIDGECRLLAEGFAARWALEPRTITFARRTAGQPRDPRQRLAIWTLSVESREGRQIARVETVGSLDFGYGFLAGGELVWNRQLLGHEELWIADFR